VAKRKHPHSSYLVIAYIVHRHYGGPEEGGWWYEGGERIRVLKVFRKEADAWKYASRVNDRITKWGVPLWRTGGYGFRAKVYRDRSPQFFPTKTPRYS